MGGFPLRFFFFRRLPGVTRYYLAALMLVMGPGANRFVICLPFYRVLKLGATGEGRRGGEWRGGWSYTIPTSYGGGVGRGFSGGFSSSVSTKD